MSEKEIVEGYKIRLNRVFQYIDENLDSALSLDRLAEIAFFSPFHFHRVFKFLVGETLNEYVTRQRIEKSALDLLHQRCTTTEAAHKYGFSDNSSFSKAFKKYYKSSPTAFIQQNPHRNSKIRQLESKNGQAYPDLEKYICVIDDLKNWIKMNAKIEVKEMPKISLAYVSCLGEHHLEAAFAKLIQWAIPLGLMNEKTKMVTMYHDSFKVTEPAKVRTSASIWLDKPVETSGEIMLQSLEPGKYIVGSFEITTSEFEKSWTGLFLWMNENGYKKSERNAFEVYHNNFNEHPQKIAMVDFCIPIQ